MVLIIEKVNMEGLGISNQMGHDTSKAVAKMNDCGSNRNTSSYTSSNDNRIDRRGKSTSVDRDMMHSSSNICRNTKQYYINTLHAYALDAETQHV